MSLPRPRPKSRWVTCSEPQVGLERPFFKSPFDGGEEPARIGAVARRYSGNPNPLIALGDLSIDLAERRVAKAGRPVPLTAREWVLFEAFLQKPGQLLSKPQLEERLYSFDAEVESNTIEVHVSRLRKKLDPDGSLQPIETLRGRGYCFTLQEKSG